MRAAQSRVTSLASGTAKISARAGFSGRLILVTPLSTQQVTATRSWLLASCMQTSHRLRSTIADSNDDDQASGDGTVVNFGKYRGSTYEHVLSEDPQYCEWVVRKAESGDGFDAMNIFATFLRNSGVAAKASDGGSKFYPNSSPKSFAQYGGSERSGSFGGSYTRGGGAFSESSEGGPSVSSGTLRVAFGKHKGLTFAELYANEREYCDWIIRKFINEPQQGKGHANSWMLVAYVQYRQLQRE